MSSVSAFDNHPGCQYDQHPDTAKEVHNNLAQTGINYERVDFWQSVCTYRNTLKERGIVPSDLTDRLREINDKAGYIFSLYIDALSRYEYNRIPPTQTINTTFGKIKFTYTNAEDTGLSVCPFKYTPLKTDYCQFYSTIHAQLLNEKNGKSVVLTYGQLHQLALHEFPFGKKADVMANQIADFVFADANPPTV